MCDKASLAQLLKDVYQYAQKCFMDDLDAVILYGSYARGDSNAESDVDIMILVAQTSEQLAQQRKTWNRFGTDLDLKYNVVTSFKLQDLKTFNEWREVLPFFRNVESEGVRISA